MEQAAREQRDQFLFAAVPGTPTPGRDPCTDLDDTRTQKHSYKLPRSQCNRSQSVLHPRPPLFCFISCTSPELMIIMKTPAASGVVRRPRKGLSALGLDLPCQVHAYLDTSAASPCAQFNGVYIFFGTPCLFAAVHFSLTLDFCPHSRRLRSCALRARVGHHGQA